MSAFLDVEVSEMADVRRSVSEEEFNSWFDASPIKARFKKACMVSQGLRCCYCQKYQHTDNNSRWDLEHVLAEGTYPQFFATVGNLVLACDKCNNAKKQKDALVETYQRPPTTLPSLPEDYIIPHPLLTNWDEHLTHTNYSVYFAKTDQGGALMTMCELNDLAMKKAGLPPESVGTTAADIFFDVMRDYVPGGLSNDIALSLSARLVEASENQRRDLLLAKIRQDLAKLERSALKRALPKESERT